jgi:hypothetical protein
MTAYADGQFWRPNRASTPLGLVSIGFRSQVEGLGMPRGDIAIVLGARPEMIKLAGVMQAACGRAHVANTGQQRIATRVLTLVK